MSAYITKEGEQLSNRTPTFSAEEFSKNYELFHFNYAETVRKINIAEFINTTLFNFDPDLTTLLSVTPNRLLTDEAIRPQVNYLSQPSVDAFIRNFGDLDLVCSQGSSPVIFNTNRNLARFADFERISNFTLLYRTFRDSLAGQLKELSADYDITSGLTTIDTGFHQSHQGTLHATAESFAEWINRKKSNIFTGLLSRLGLVHILNGTNLAPRLRNLPCIDTCKVGGSEKTFYYIKQEAQDKGRSFCDNKECPLRKTGCNRYAGLLQKEEIPLPNLQQ